LSLLEDAAKSFPDFELFHRDCVAILLHEGKKEQALERANRNILNFKGNYDMWIDCGAVYSRMGQYKRAEESYRMALSLQPNAQDAWFNWANMLLERQQYAQAEEHYLRVVRINPDNEEAWLQLAYCCLFSHDYYVALRYLEKGLTLKRNESAFFYVRSLVLEELQDLDGALSNIDKALKRGNDEELWKQLIKLLRKKGEDTTNVMQYMEDIIR
ncbi:MAG: tetratricopeptide repeat protein, partial [Myxococcota bacterium]|nr:tetratricopeptide repeat protein [Myxococcota bacterium]